MASAKGKIAIIGSGLIGCSWSMIFAGAEYDVYMYDNRPEQLVTALEDIKQQFVDLEAKGLLRGDISADEQFEHITTSSDFEECLKGAKHIQECAPELLVVKRKIFTDLDKLVDNDVTIGSSTSAIPSSRFTHGLTHNNQMLVVHPTNPPYYVPLVELVPAPWTDSKVTDAVYTLMAEVGQVPVKLNREIYGFALPRVHHAILVESWKMIQEGILSVEDMDKVMSEGLGTRYAFMGPLETRHLNFDGGFKSGCRPYVYNVSQLSGPTPRLEGPMLDIVHNDFNTRIPMETLAERRKWRDVRIASLSKLKREMNKQ